MTFEIQDTLGKEFYKRCKPSKRKKIVTEAIKRELNQKEKKDTLWKIPELAREIEVNDVSENHDKYLLEDLIERKTNL